MTPARLVRELCAHGPRLVGSPGHARARALLAAELAGLGGRLVREPFPVEVDADLAVDCRLDGVPIPALRFARTGGGAEGTVEAGLRWCGAGGAGDFAAARGQVAVVRAGLRHHRIRQVESAAAAGAVALVCLGRDADEPEQGLGSTPEGYAAIPGIGCGRRWEPAMRHGRALRLGWRVDRRQHQGENLILDLPGLGAPRLLAAHYDAWGGGAADNAAGVAVAIAAVRRLARQARRPALRLALFDAEELGLLGSAWHVRQGGGAGLGACLNLDQPVPGRGAWTRTIFLGLGLVAGPAPLLALRHGFLPLPLDWIYRVIGEVFPSDVHHFHRSGVAAGSTFCAGPRHLERDRPGGLEPAGLERAVALAVDLALAGRS